MTESQRDGPRTAAERVAKIIGVVSAAVGLLVTIVGLPGTVASALGRSTESKTASLELDRTRAALADAGARLEVKYIVMRYDLVNVITYQAEAAGGERRPEREAVARTFASYRVVKTDVLDELTNTERGPRSAPCWQDNYANLSVTFLAITNRGKRDAAGVSLATERLDLRGPVTVRERTGGGDDYVAKLRGAAQRKVPADIGISETLGPGDGVLIPLWLTGERRDRPGPWCVVSRTAFEPRTVSFSDAHLGPAEPLKVRRMVAPTILANGVEGRG